MQELLDAIKLAVAKQAPDAVANLGPAATSNTLQQLKDAFPEAPAEFIHMLSIHDGESIGASMLTLMPNYMELLPVQQILEVHQWNSESDNELIDDLDSLGVRDGFVKPVFSYVRRIPFACCNGDVYWYLDLDPAPGGEVGQVVHDDAECMVLRVIAPSLTALLQNYIDDLQANRFSIESGQLVTETDWPFKD